MDDSHISGLHAVDQIHSNTDLEPSALPPSIPLLHTIPSSQMLPGDDTWQLSIQEDNRLSANAEFPWPFQDGRIFKLSSGAYTELSSSEYLDPFIVDYGPEQNNTGLHGLEFVGILFSSLSPPTFT
jgi:hypothetical protein